MPPRSVEKKYGFENPFKPDPLSRKAVRHIPKGGRLLDVGCGEGADSAFFAKRGFDVTAIDKNAAYLKRFGRYCREGKISGIAIARSDAVRYRYPRNKYDVIICLLVICCMKRSDCEKLVRRLKRAVKPGGIIVLSSRNYMDPELAEYKRTSDMIEPNTFCAREACTKYLYFVEKGRLLELFRDFDIRYSREGFAPCKYGEHPRHGDSTIICARKR